MTSKENVENGRREYIEVGCRKEEKEKEYVRREGKKSNVGVGSVTHDESGVGRDLPGHSIMAKE